MIIIFESTSSIIKSCLCTHRHCRPLTCAPTGTERWRRTWWRSPWRHIGPTIACSPPPRSKGRWRRRTDADVGTSAAAVVATTPPASRPNWHGRHRVGVRHSEWFGTRPSCWSSSLAATEHWKHYTTRLLRITISWSRQRDKGLQLPRYAGASYNVF